MAARRQCYSNAVVTVRRQCYSNAANLPYDFERKISGLYTTLIRPDGDWVITAVLENQLAAC